MQAAVHQFTRFSRIGSEIDELIMRRAKVFAFCHVVFSVFWCIVWWFRNCAIYNWHDVFFFKTYLHVELPYGELIAIEHLQGLSVPSIHS